MCVGGGGGYVGVRVWVYVWASKQADGLCMFVCVGMNLSNAMH